MADGQQRHWHLVGTVLLSDEIYASFLGPLKPMVLATLAAYVSSSRAM